MKIKLNKSQYYILMEALRRYIKFNDKNQSITECWTGLGHESYARKVIDAGLMNWSGNHPPSYRCSGWLCLTEKGAKIVSKWIDQGYVNIKFFAVDDIEWEYPINSNGDMPPFAVEID